MKKAKKVVAEQFVYRVRYSVMESSVDLLYGRLTAQVIAIDAEAAIAAVKNKVVNTRNAALASRVKNLQAQLASMKKHCDDKEDIKDHEDELKEVQEEKIAASDIRIISVRILAPIGLTINIRRLRNGHIGYVP